LLRKRAASFGGLIAGVTAIALLAAACSTNNGSSSGGSSGGGGKTIALLLPETKTTRYEAQDKPLFEARVKALCSDCKIIYSNANQDASAQQSQADAALTNGAKVMVLDPVDSASAASIVSKAKAKNVPVISYDRLILNAPVDYYISFDNVQVGKLQASSLVDKLKADGKKGSVVMINGAPTDNNAKLFKQGALSALNGKVKIAKQYDTPDWSADKAQTEMSQAITAVGKSNINGVYSANDGLGAGIVAAEKGAGMDPTKVPLTGQDAEVDGIQRIVSGQQSMTVYKPVEPLADAAAKIAGALAQGKPVPSGLINTKTNNGTADIPTVKLNTITVTKDNVKSTVFKDGYVTAAQVCTGPYAAGCKSLGIS
jgi:D-xylose transport system substrate-binding protein